MPAAPASVHPPMANRHSTAPTSLPDRIIDNIGADDEPSNRRKSIEAGELSVDDDDSDAENEHDIESAR